MGKNVGAITVKVKANGKDYADTAVVSLSVIHQLNTVFFGQINKLHTNARTAKRFSLHAEGTDTTFATNV